jgi:hypothetical protein
MNFVSLVGSLELFEFWKLTVRVNVGISLGLHVRLNHWENKTDDGFTLDIALGLVQGLISVHANK